uniref:Uncharacterized protein n=1 Tax=Arundo donax TaxID=35708 RepID=A0A0A9SYX9_ARUDO
MCLAVKLYLLILFAISIHTARGQIERILYISWSLLMVVSSACCGHFCRI